MTRKNYDWTVEDQTDKLADALDLLERCYAAQVEALKTAKVALKAGDTVAVLYAMKIPREVDGISRGAAEQRVEEAAGWLAYETKKG